MNCCRKSHALWWLQRWISGSMNDPDWEWLEAANMTLQQAFGLIGSVTGNARSINRPALWRSLIVPKTLAQKVKLTLILPPNLKSHYQSFSGSREVAEEFCDEMHRPRGTVHLMVSIKPDSKIIPFGMADLLQSKNGEVQRWLGALDHWHHQDEVLVQVVAPLPLLSAEFQK